MYFWNSIRILEKALWFVSVFYGMFMNCIPLCCQNVLFANITALYSEAICMCIIYKGYRFSLAADLRCYQIWGLPSSNNGTGRLLAIGKTVDTQVIQGAGTTL
jgi:hypothetical protein